MTAPYTVSGELPVGALANARRSAAAAAERAAEMTRQGFQNIVIRDREGRAYTPAQFAAVVQAEAE